MARDQGAEESAVRSPPWADRLVSKVNARATLSASPGGVAGKRIAMLAWPRWAGAQCAVVYAPGWGPILPAGGSGDAASPGPFRGPARLALQGSTLISSVWDWQGVPCRRLAHQSPPCAHTIATYRGAVYAWRSLRLQILRRLQLL
jgi:hypothetical protein